MFGFNRFSYIKLNNILRNANVLQSSIKSFSNTKFGTNQLTLTRFSYLVRNDAKIRQYSTKTEKTTKISAEEERRILTQKLKENKTRNILIFSKETNRSLMTNIAGLVAATVILGMSYFSYELFSTVQIRKQKEDEEPGFLQRVVQIIGKGSFRNIVCSLVVLVGLGAAGMGFLFSLRQVQRLYLIKGSKQLGVITEGVFGNEKSYLFNLEDTSFRQQRSDKTTLIPFKAKKTFFFFLIDKSDGTFNEEVLFDYYICLKRPI